MLGACVLGDRGTHGVRAVEGRDAGGHALGGLDGEGEVGAMLAVGAAHHQRQAQLAATLGRQREADQAAAVARHEVHVLGSHLRGGHDEVALVLAALVVEDDDHATGGEVGEDVLDAVETVDRRGIGHHAQRHAAAPAASSRST